MPPVAYVPCFFGQVMLTKYSVLVKRALKLIWKMIKNIFLREDTHATDDVQLPV